MHIHLHYSCTSVATAEIYTLSLHDALPISEEWERRRRFPFFAHEKHRHLRQQQIHRGDRAHCRVARELRDALAESAIRSEEHTSELQSRFDLVCRLLLEKKKKQKMRTGSQH